MIIHGREKSYEVIIYEWSSLKVMLIITMQYPLGVPPNLRTNIDYTFILWNLI